MSDDTPKRVVPDLSDIVAVTMRNFEAQQEAKEAHTEACKAYLKSLIGKPFTGGRTIVDRREWQVTPRDA